jgi:hypothetical protein
VTVGAGAVRVLHAGREVAGHAELKGRRGRTVDPAHLAGIAGCRGAPLPIRAAAAVIPDPAPALLRPLAEYKAAIGGGF